MTANVVRTLKAGLTTEIDAGASVPFLAYLPAGPSSREKTWCTNTCCADGEARGSFLDGPQLLFFSLSPPAELR